MCSEVIVVFIFGDAFANVDIFNSFIGFSLTLLECIVPVCYDSTTRIIVPVVNTRWGCLHEESNYFNHLKIDFVAMPFCLRRTSCF